MKWILNRDYNVTIRQEVKQMVMGDNAYTLADAEATAIEIASGYLRGKYDTVAIFFDIPLNKTLADEGGTLAINTICRDANDTIYKALVADANPLQLTDTDQWQATDPRNKAMLLAVCNIALYLMHSNLAPRNIPDLMVKNFDDAMSYLKAIQKESIVPNLPLLSSDVVSTTFTLSGNTKTTEKW